MDERSVLPHIVSLAGGLLLLVGGAQAVFTLGEGGSLLEILIDFILISAPGVALLYAGVWVSASRIEPTFYPRLIAWVLGGVVVMFGFIVLRDLHPGVTVEWSLGTQAIALTIGSIGGLLIGIQETRATMQTEQLERQTRTLEKYTDQLERREAELERRNEQLDRFASVVSHDLRNPLAVAQGRLELLREEYDSEHVEPIDGSLTRMEVLVDDLLTLAREGNRVSDVEPTHLGVLAESCWQTVGAADAELRQSVDRTIRADRSRTQQLLENLFRNAVEHGSTSTGSQARQDADGGDAAAEPSLADAREDAVEDGGAEVTVTVGELEDGFYVEDDGPGIPDRDREAIFEPGFSTAADGTGFGLSIVKQVADAHGWSFRVTDGDLGGARFEVTGVDIVE